MILWTKFDPLGLNEDEPEEPEEEEGAKRSEIVDRIAIEQSNLEKQQERLEKAQTKRQEVADDMDNDKLKDNYEYWDSQAKFAENQISQFQKNIA
ncbi:MAG: hypothetical protein AAGH40_05670 [Verrucomicrobiota bacterium]